MLLKVLFVFVIIFMIASCFLYWKWDTLKKIYEEEAEINESNLKNLNVLKKRFSKIISLDDEVEKVQDALNDLSLKYSSLHKEKLDLELLIKEDKVQLAIYSDDLELNSYGFYKPSFGFDKSEEFKEQVILVREKQKAMIKAGEAIFCNVAWNVGGDKKKGEKMVKDAIKLTSRAFINECDVFISSAQWNNLNQIVQKIENSFKVINKANEINQVFISEKFKDLKILELKLNFEYKNKLKEEKEEIAEEKRIMREEAREIAKNEAERIKAEDEAERFQKMLEKAKQEANALVVKNQEMSQEKLDLLNKNISDLEAKLIEAEAKKERAKSMAQQTKSGHVYIISNIGSFGENIYKIGMTRRLEPLDRIDELGDASVPFVFDIHAIIYSDNAPALENQLHKKFHSRRLNLINHRKEFFHVSLEEIQEEVLRQFPDSKFRLLPEAEDYRKSLDLRKSLQDGAVLDG